MSEPKPLELVTVTPPPPEQRARRDARFVGPDERRTRYSLPTGLESASPIGYRTRLRLERTEGEQALKLLSLRSPRGFGPIAPVREQELFEEAALGVLSSRQSTNYQGHRQVTFGPAESARITRLLQTMAGTAREPALEDASYTHVILSKPYRTPFTLLLTFVGHKPIRSLLSVPARAVRKRFGQAVDIPTIGYLQHLHLGILAETLDRAVVIASGGQRRAQFVQTPFCPGHRSRNAAAIAELETLCGLGATDRQAGWAIAMVVQVGTALAEDRVELPGPLWRKLGAELMAFRSERIQPGVNQEDKSPGPYQSRQAMDVSEAFTIQAGRAAYNAFSRWTGVERDEAKRLLVLDRVDVLTPDGKERLRAIRSKLESITDRVVAEIPKWADLPLARALSRNAERGRKAFALAGQRIYIAGLARREVAEAGLEWELAVRAVGAAGARASLYAELMGVVDLPDDCDLLAGVCMMAGPVNQDDIGKTFYGMPDLLAENPSLAARNPTSLLVWTFKAKTVADPIGNEEQLLNPARKGALVELRGAPHDLVSVAVGERWMPMRSRAGKHNRERAFHDQNNFVRDAKGTDIPGNPGEAWPKEWADAAVWIV